MKKYFNFWLVFSICCVLFVGSIDAMNQEEKDKLFFRSFIQKVYSDNNVSGGCIGVIGHQAPRRNRFAKREEEGLNELLIKACREGKLSEVEALIKRGAIINTKDARFGFSLHYAVFYGRVEVVKYLLEKGADIKALCKRGSIDNNTVLHLVVKSNDIKNEEERVKILTLLLENGAADIVDAQDGIGWTPLHYAVFDGRVEVVKYLLEKGADIKVSCGEVGNVLHLAIGFRDMKNEEQRLKIVKLLVEKGADINKVGAKNRIPLWYAIELGNIEIVKYLIEKGDKIDFLGECGKNLLSIITSKIASGKKEIRALSNDGNNEKQQQLKILNLLVRNKADINPKDGSICSNCSLVLLGKEKMLRCSACKSVFYCSVHCQRQDWNKRHKKECKLLQSKHPILKEIKEIKKQFYLFKIRKKELEKEEENLNKKNKKIMNGISSLCQHIKILNQKIEKENLKYVKQEKKLEKEIQNLEKEMCLPIKKEKDKNIVTKILELEKNKKENIKAYNKIMGEMLDKKKQILSVLERIEKIKKVFFNLKKEHNNLNKKNFSLDQSFNQNLKFLDHKIKEAKLTYNQQEKKLEQKIKELDEKLSSSISIEDVKEIEKKLTLAEEKQKSIREISNILRKIINEKQEVLSIFGKIAKIKEEFKEKKLEQQMKDLDEKLCLPINNVKDAKKILKFAKDKKKIIQEFDKGIEKNKEMLFVLEEMERREAEFSFLKKELEGLNPGKNIAEQIRKFEKDLSLPINNVGDAKKKKEIIEKNNNILRSITKKKKKKKLFAGDKPEKSIKNEKDAEEESKKINEKFIVHKGDKFTIEWFFNKSGVSNASKYFNELPLERKNKVRKEFTNLDRGKWNEQKFRTERNKGKGKGNPIYVLKTKSDRFMCFFSRDSKIIITNAYEKKCDKRPKGVGEKAELRKKDYEERCEKGIYYASENNLNK